MEFILINSEGLMTSAQRAEIITRELYNITRPVFIQKPDEAANTLFEVLYHPANPTQAALIVDTSQVIKVHQNCTLEKLVAVFPELTSDERYALSSMVHQTKAFPFGLILPDTVTVRDLKYMITNGWIPQEEE